jgi:tetratricopeptide (TPR) repeat protein
LILAVPAAAQDTTGQEGAGAQEQTSLTIADNLLDRSFSAYDAENYDQALLDVSLYVLLNPTATQGYYVRALVQAARQQPEEALEDLDRALVLAEGDLYGVQYRAGLLSTRASIRQGTGDVEGALVDYAAALEVAPSADSYRGRAFLYAQQGDFEEALADIDAAIALTPEEQAGGLYLARASVNERAGDVETAAADYLTYVQSIATDVLNEDVIVSDEIRELEMVPGRVYTLPFQANRGDILTAAAAADEAGGVDALLILITTEGEPLVANDDRAADDLSAVIGEYSIPATDTYVLLLTHSGGGSSGTVRVVINLQPPT